MRPITTWSSSSRTHSPKSAWRPTRWPRTRETPTRTSSDSKRDLILQASPMIGPTRKSLVHVLRFRAPAEPGIYPYVCTFPGHWVVMNGELVVAKDLADVEAMLAARQPAVVKEWTLADFPDVSTTRDEPAVMKGMQAFV